jgi:hypothetical protein
MLTLTKLNKYILKKDVSNPCTYINQMINGIIRQNHHNQKIVYLIRKNKAILHISLFFDHYDLKLTIDITGYNNFKRIHDSANFFKRNSRKLWKLIDIMINQISYDEDLYDNIDTQNQWLTINLKKQIIYNNVLSRN